jgi:outer membrane receptor protein involved in Fe transport
VVDDKQQPLPGATVALVGTPYGGFTDNDGVYNILNLPPGKYSVQISFVGYETLVVHDVVVSTDQSTQVDGEIKETAIAAGEIVVNAKRLPVDLDLTDTRSSLSSEEIEQLPVQDLEDVVNLQAGVVNGHFRGGRLGEVQFLVDGASVNNPYDHASTLTLDRSVLKEVQVINGTFDAEYGQAMSGVVNAVLKDGTEDFEWSAEAFFGGFAFPGNESRVVDFEAHPGSSQNVQATASGPITSDERTRYLLSARYATQSDAFHATRRFVPTDQSDFEQKIWRPTGDNADERLGYLSEWSGLGKLAHFFRPNMKLSYEILFDIAEGQRNDYNYRLNPDGLNEQHYYAATHGFDWNQELSPATILEVSLRHNHFHYTDWAYEDAFDPRYDAAGPAIGDPSYELGAIIQGVDLNRFEQRSNTFMMKSSVASQVNSEHLIKVGGELFLPRIEFGVPGWLIFTTVDGVQQLVRRIDDPPDFPAPIEYRPIIADGYIQDRIEWEDLTVRAGLRFDYFSARSFLPGDLANPANAIQGAPAPPDVPTTSKTTVSPRLGIAYPIGDRAGIHIAYGHFYQYPGIGTMFANADYNILSNLQASGIEFGVLGNPDVKPERTVQYEIGYRRAITTQIGIDATTFYKDIRDLLGVEFVSTYNDAQYARLTNVDFGDVVGITVAMDFIELGPTTIALDYTWQQAMGNASDPHETSVRAEAGEDPRPRLIPFIWDQRHTLNTTITYAQPRYSVSAILRASSGQPYTPVLETGFGLGLEANSGRKPAGFLVDLRAETALYAAGPKVSLFGRVFNVFDSEFWNGEVFSSTGSPHYSRFPEADEVKLADPTRLYPPRQIEIGIRLGAEGT